MKNLAKHITFLMIVLLNSVSLFSFTEEEENVLNLVLEELYEYDGLKYVLYGNRPLLVTSLKDINSYPEHIQKKRNLNALHEASPYLEQLTGETPYFRVSYHLGEDKVPYFLFINKISLKKVIHDNLNIFQTRLEQNLSESDVYEKIITGSVDEFFKHTALTIILSGFGTQDALLTESTDLFREEFERDVNVSNIYQMDNPFEARAEYGKLAKAYAIKHREKWGHYLEELEQLDAELLPGIPIPFAYTEESIRIDEEMDTADRIVQQKLKNKSYLQLTLDRLNE